MSSKNEPQHTRVPGVLSGLGRGRDFKIKKIIKKDLGVNYQNIFVI